MDKVPDMVAKTLDVIAQRFGATGAHLWSVIVQEQINESIVSLIGWGGIWIAAVYMAHRWADKWRDPEDEDLDWVRPLLHGVTMVLAFIAITTIGIDIQCLLNPEFYALNYLMGALPK